MKVCGSTERAASSATFRQLLRALHAEHERELGLLAAEVEHLRASKDTHGTNNHSTAAEAAGADDDFSAVVPCMPLAGLLGPRRGGPRCGRWPLALAAPHRAQGWSAGCGGGCAGGYAAADRPPSGPEGQVLGASAEALGGGIFSNAPSSQVLEFKCNSKATSIGGAAAAAFASEEPRGGAGAAGDLDLFPAELPRRPPKGDGSAGGGGGAAANGSSNQNEGTKSGAGTLIRKHTADRLNDMRVWPVWENLYVSRTKDHEPWLHEALKSRIAAGTTRQNLPTPWQGTSSVMSSSAGLATLRRSGTRKQPKKEPFCPTLPLHPRSRTKMIWDLCAPIALMYDFIVIPLQVFQFEESLGRKVVEGIILCYWVLDMVVAFSSAFYNDRGEVIKEYRLIAKRYLRTWFLPDILITGFDIITTSISWSWAADANGSQNVGLAKMGKFLRIARIVRTLRFIRIAKLREVIYGIQVHFDSEAIAIAWGLCLNIFTLLVLNHITACLWFWIGSEKGQEFTWLTVPFQGDRTWAEAGKWEVYFVSLHWSLTLFTPASMSVQPENLHERIYAVVCLMLAMVVFASFVSTVTAGMTRLRFIQTDNMEQSYKLQRFLRENKISADLVARVTRYVDIAMRSNTKRVPKEAVVRLKWLSQPLHMELMWELSAPLLGSHLFFSGYGCCSVSAMRELCSNAIKTVAISTRDSLFTSFMEATCMYFVRDGLLLYKRARGLRFPRRVCLEKKDWFVEHVLWMKWVHHGTMKAVTESSLMAVNSQKVREVSLAHPDVLVMSAEYAVSFAAQVEGKDTCDVPQAVFDRYEIRPEVGEEGYLDEVLDDIVFSSESEYGDEAVEDCGASPK